MCPLTTTPGKSRKSRDDRVPSATTGRASSTSMLQPPCRITPQQILRCGENFTNRQFLHAPMIEWTNAQLTRSARYLSLQVDTFGEIRLGPVDKRRPEERHDGPIERGREVAWTAVGRHEQIESANTSLCQSEG